MKMVIVTGTGTNIGKTYFCKVLANKLNADFELLKPVISGWSAKENDTKCLLNALNKNFDKTNINNCSPWRFEKACSPDLAAKVEKRKVDFYDVVNFCKKPRQVYYTIIEAAGGVMTPVNDDKTFLDLAEVLKCRVLLVTGSYLGSISHCLTAYLALKSRGINDVKVILNQSENCVGLEDTFQSLKNHGVTPDVIIPRMKDDESWENMPDLTQLVK